MATVISRAELKTERLLALYRQMQTIRRCEEHLARVLATVERIAHAHPGERVLIVSHGGSLRALRRHCTGEPVHPIANCGVYELSFEDGAFAAID